MTQRGILGLPTRALKRLGRECRTRLVWQRNFDRLRQPKRVGGIDYTPEDHVRIVDGLREAGVAVQDFHIDTGDFRRYLADADYRRYRWYHRGGAAAAFVEKSLEHYLAARLLALSACDVYIDIANDCSPAPDIYRRLHGCVAYRQDLSFKPGVHGDSIGGSAANLPLADGFATKMALHCSFEHFESDADIGFIQEAGRVLAPGGALCIVPLYVHKEYAILTDPAEVPPGFDAFEPDATLYCVKGLGNRHQRFYDVPHLLGRVVRHLGPLNMTVFLVHGASAVGPHCHLRFAACFRRTA